MKHLEQILALPTTTLKDVMEMVGRGAVGIVLVVDENCHLLATITDGDIRRSILKGTDLREPIMHLLSQRKLNYGSPIVAKVGTPRAELIRLMNEKSIRHVPLLNDYKQVVDLALLDDPDLPLSAVVMAGGLGQRLRPLTEKLPKPMLPMGDKPLMELIVKQLSLSGIKRVFVTTHYLGDKIEEHFGNGQNFGIEMLYIAEEQLLGTAGGVKLVPEQQSPMLIVNGDILTEVDFRAMHAFHAEHEAELTVGVRQFTMQVPYGVIESDGWRVKRVVEKPMQDVFVNAGIYLMEPHVQTLIPAYQKFDMTDLITLLVARGSIVACFPIWEYWRDIGQPADYEQAQSDIRNGKLHS